MTSGGRQGEVEVGAGGSLPRGALSLLLSKDSWGRWLSTLREEFQWLRDNPPTGLGELPEPLVGRPSFFRINRYCSDVVRAAGLPCLADPDELIHRVAQLRGRETRVWYRRLDPGVTSFTCQMKDSPLLDTMVVGVNKPGEKQVRGKFHECMHILCGHVDRDGESLSRHERGDVVSDEEYVAETGGLILWRRSMLYRSSFGFPPVEESTRRLDRVLRTGEPVVHGERGWL